MLSAAVVRQIRVLLQMPLQNRNEFAIREQIDHPRFALAPVVGTVVPG